MKKFIKKNSKKGFTLIELIVVIAIVAILAAIAVPTMNGIIRNSRQKAADADAKSLASSVSMLLTKYETGEDNTIISGVFLSATAKTKAMEKAGIKDPDANVLISLQADADGSYSVKEVKITRDHIIGTFPRS